jgi:hypothetical protein
MKSQYGDRFQVRTGVDFDATPPSVGPDGKPGVKLPDGSRVSGNSLVNAMPRDVSKPPTIMADAYPPNSGVRGMLLFDDTGHYLGYVLMNPNGNQVLVTGAASRTPPLNGGYTWPSGASDALAQANARDAAEANAGLPADQAGNFAPGAVATSLQGARLRAYLEQHPVPAWTPVAP